MNKNDISIDLIEKLLKSVSDDVKIISIAFEENNELILTMQKTLTAAKKKSKKVSMDELMALISKIENYSEIDE
ncbi:hypothetical protein [uncultured Eubacterium sp.]|uniref:hypothetical protein n=1 Tax=uncultured Eubacterium sp. TaxID=165185 RepID=UPI0025FD052D|nr:hypothetical protein [uncultured Eubacterium sp.]